MKKTVLRSNIKGDEEFAQSFWDILGDHQNLKNKFGNIIFESQGDMTLLKKHILKLMSVLHKVQKPKTLKEKFNGWLNPTQGTLDQLRLEFESDYVCKRHFQTTKDLIQIDTMILLHPDNKSIDDPQNIEKLRYLEKCLDGLGGTNRNANRMSDQMRSSEHYALEMTTNNVNLGETMDLGNFMIVCNPNAGYYEFSCFDKTFIDFFLEKKINLILWNYRGFGKSKGTCTMKNLLKDGHSLVDFARNKLMCKNIALYGRSLGGYVAVNLVDKVDIVIADRTFSTISMIPRVMMAKWIQKVFDFYLDNDKISIEKFIKTDTQKIIMFDSTDEIVNQFAALTTGITSHFAEQYFKKKSNSPDIEKKYFGKKWSKAKFGIMKCTNGRSNRVFSWLNKLACYGFKCNKGFKVNDKFYTNMMENMKTSSLIISDSDCWILFLAMKRIINIITNIKSAMHRLGYKRLERHRQNSEYEFSNLSLKFDSMNEMDSNKKLDEVWLKSIHETNENFDENSEKRNFEDKSFDYELLFKLDDVTLDQARFLDRILESLGNIESASLTALDVFQQNSVCYQYPAFRLLILNMAFWGSYMPASAILNSNIDVKDPLFYSGLSKHKLQSILKKLGQYKEILEKDEKEFMKTNQEGILNIIEDLTLVINRLKILQHGQNSVYKEQYAFKKIPNKYDNESNVNRTERETKDSLSSMNKPNNDTSVLSSNSEEFSQENIFTNFYVSKNKQNEDGETLIMDNSEKIALNEEAPEQLKKTNFTSIKRNLMLVPQKCGHNNPPSDTEMNVLGKLQCHSGFLKKENCVNIFEDNDEEMPIDKYEISMDAQEENSMNLSF